MRDYLKKLNKENSLTETAQIKVYMSRLKGYGMEINRYYPESIRKVSKEGIWELRPGGSRVFFFHYDGKKIILLHAYKKQGQKAPPSEIEKAVNEMKDYKRRNQGGK